MEIEHACLDEAQRQFTQANDTPMLQQPLLDIFRIDDMETPAFEPILEGTFQCPAECNIYLQKLLVNLK